MKKEPTSFRLSPEAQRLLRLIAEKLGISKSAVLEIMIREKAKQEHIDDADADNRT